MALPKGEDLAGPIRGRGIHLLEAAPCLEIGEGHVGANRRQDRRAPTNLTNNRVGRKRPPPDSDSNWT